jgi:GH15 family glucan-1,4-alpha-glucosidase
MNSPNYKPISSYGVIGDMHSAALVGLDGSIDWLCFPRFDSPSIFAAILDARRGGSFRLCPVAPFASKQTYLDDTNVLSTLFTTDRGKAEILDFMPLGEDPRYTEHHVFRVVKGITGEVPMECWYQPRLDYARGATHLTPCPRGVTAQKDSDRLVLASPVVLEVEQGLASAAFTVGKGEELVFALQWSDASEPPDIGGWRQRLEQTCDMWRGIANSVKYEGHWQEVARRSVLALHLLVYMPTGALVAAVTTSLPEWIGGTRNWDYRYCWVRDASFIVDVLDRLDHTAETGRFLKWLTTECESCGINLQTLYGVEYEEDLKEAVLEHLEGYKGSKPVRTGNAASKQFQMDIFREAIVAVATFHRAGGEINDRLWATVQSFVDAVISNWDRPDCSIWEVRSRKRHFVYSKVMCWMAMDRAISIAEAAQKPADLRLWRKVRDEIREDILKRGWNDRLQSFVQYYGASHTDAVLLMMPLVGFLPPDDPRMQSTILRIRQELEVNGLLRRYQPHRADDGVGGEEGIFLMCTLWLAGCLTMIGDIGEATRLVERVLQQANHLGLFSEMVNPLTGEALGNFPQAFTHVSLIHTLHNLDIAMSRTRLSSTP